MIVQLNRDLAHVSVVRRCTRRAVVKRPPYGAMGSVQLPGGVGALDGLFVGAPVVGLEELGAVVDGAVVVGATVVGAVGVVGEALVGAAVGAVDAAVLVGAVGGEAPPPASVVPTVLTSDRAGNCTAPRISAGVDTSAHCAFVDDTTSPIS